MKDMKRDERLRRRLRRRLREGDSAKDEPALTAEEVRAMRRAVLASVPEPRAPFRASLALAGAALAALAAVAMVTMWSVRPDPEPARPAGHPGSKMTASTREARTPPPPGSRALEDRAAGAPEPPALAASTDGQPAASIPERRWPRRPRRGAAIERPDRVASARSLEISEEAIERRQVQFSTPGGTRVIWILTTQEL